MAHWFATSDKAQARPIELPVMLRLFSKRRKQNKQDSSLPSFANPAYQIVNTNTRKQNQQDLSWPSFANPAYQIVNTNIRKHNKQDTSLPSFAKPVCQIANTNQFFEEFFKKWAVHEIRWQYGFNRKLWEYAYILNALDVYGKLSGRGLGFGVGTEPTVPVMLRHGARLVVSDLSDEEAQAKGWAPMRFDEDFRSRLELRTIDMNKIPKDLQNFDFVWSCGSLETIGGLQAGLRFIEAAMGCLNSSGIAVHTTEFKYSPGD